MMHALEAELFGSVTDVAPANNRVYQSLSNQRIPKFIKSCSLYNKKIKAWKALTSAEQKKGETYLYAPLQEIINSILSELHGREDCWVAPTHAVPMKHIEGTHVCNEDLPNGPKKTVSFKSSPDLSILGVGLHFRCGHIRPEFPDYDHCLSPVDIRQPSNYDAQTVLIQAGIYARQCFAHQPHRRYVPVIVIAGSDLYLHIYDRPGVLRHDKINIHADPDTFVRIILGVSTVGTDRRTSPFDLRVRYQGANSFPLINVKNDALDHDAQYKDTASRFARKTICGRGTYCATAEFDDRGKVVTVLIKEAWRTVERLPEYTFRDDIKGLDGVGQILFYEDDQSTITDFRRHIFPAFYETNPYNLDRRFCRLVLKAYGRSICHFSTKLELLEAFHDAIAGHKYLWKKGILHRDISVDNILLGEPGAREGNRGVLIDFDMAIRVDQFSDADKSRTGTRAFQSYALLKSSSWKKIPPQDHLDDLESSFYCLGWVCVKYDGTPAHRSPEFLNDWEKGNPESCACNKLEFLTDPVSKLNSHFDTEVFYQLFQDLAKLSRGHVMAKIAISNSKRDEFPKLSEIYSATSQGQDHDKVMAVVKTAIMAQKAEPPEERFSAESETRYPVSQEYGKFSRISLPSTGEMARLGMKRPNPNQGDRGSSSKRLRAQSSQENPSKNRSKALERQPKASGSQQKPSKSQRDSGKRVRR